MSCRRITIVHPYLPHYRIGFFQQLADDLHDRGVELVVAHGDPLGDQAARADTASLEGAIHLRQRTLRLGLRTLVHHHLDGLAKHSDAVVFEQALHNLALYPLLLSPRRVPVVALWGHAYTCLRSAGRVQRAATAAVTRRAQWFFAYTPTGAEQVAGDGLPPERITVLNHSVDTAALSGARARVGAQRLQAFRERYQLMPGRTAIYLGGLDASKRTSFLLAAAQSVARQLPGFRLLVAGNGAQRHLVEEAAEHGGETVYLGNVFGDGDRALLGAAADLMLAPGAVGLCAAVSFALRTPVVTVPWPGHGPEFEYLKHGQNALISPNGVDAFCETVVKVLQDPRLLDRLKKGCEEEARKYTMEQTSLRFADGVVRMLSVAGRRP